MGVNFELWKDIAFSNGDLLITYLGSYWSELIKNQNPNSKIVTFGYPFKSTLEIQNEENNFFRSTYR